MITIKNHDFTISIQYYATATEIMLAFWKTYNQTVIFIVAKPWHA